MKKLTYLLCITLMSVSTCLLAQVKESIPGEYLNMSWKEVATRMPEDWYGSTEAQRVAENVLLCQKDIGGWAKNKAYHHTFTEAEKAEFLASRSEIGATIDNGATVMEMQFLALVNAQHKDPRYKAAFEKGLDYLFEAQYDNGGWPQFYPVRPGNSVHYSAHITYNDNAMVNVMRLLEDIYKDEEVYPALELSDAIKRQCREAFNKGIQCILKTQIVVDGKPTVWCAQHDELTFAPAAARKYELASFSGAESAGILRVLMHVKDPSPEVIAAVNGAVAWFEEHKLEGIRVTTETDSEGRKNRIVIEDKNAPPLWARFYDLDTGQPFFCDRDGIPKATMTEIGYERRNGYSWYTDSPSEVLEKYPEWLKKVKSK